MLLLLLNIIVLFSASCFSKSKKQCHHNIKNGTVSIQGTSNTKCDYGNSILFKIDNGDNLHNTLSSMAILNDDIFVVTWEGYDPDATFDPTSIYASIFQVGIDGKVSNLITQFQVSEKSIFDQKTPVVTKVSDSHFLIAYASIVALNPETSFPRASRIVAQIFDKNANPINTPFLINDAEFKRDETNPAIIQLNGPNGGYLITWLSVSASSLLDDGNGKVHGRIFSSENKPVGNSFILNTLSTNVLSYSVASLQGGDFVAVWASRSTSNPCASCFACIVTPYKNIFAQIFDSDGNKRGPEFQVNDFIKGDNSDPSVAALTSGGFIVSWIESSSMTSTNQVVTQAYDASYSRLKRPVGSHSGAASINRYIDFHSF
jgi:hypothetical protein